ncbi:hypothetical protein CROQUDRAFT_675188 [Cronartium quercuum f. sp. fusiforme G11]|uniref:Uncharacterized protein n=1 Tax=Cronartium quercuum f. sp. fusiforme G11 TaxID=708437 RepID=A0A9P6N5V3_9BASI|nr:hypothetical protein CROQUDRAFT_675188 [Cronartium quercuum f. sp. fusiforme G11]
MRTPHLILILAAAVSYMMNVVTGVGDIGKIASATQGLFNPHLREYLDNCPRNKQFYSSSSAIE